jgi:hypothetical protein
MPSSRPDDRSSKSAGACPSVAPTASKRARETDELCDHLDNKRIQFHTPSSSLVPTTPDQAAPSSNATHTSPSLNVSVDDGGDDDDGDDRSDDDDDSSDGATTYKPLERALEDAELDFQWSLSDFVATNYPLSEDGAEVKDTSKAPWGLEEDGSSNKAASRAVIQRLRSDISCNDTVSAIMGHRINDPRNTEWLIQIDAERIIEPSFKTPLSVEFQVCVGIPNPKGDELHEFPLGPYVRRDKEGKWTVNAEEYSIVAEDETGEEQEEEYIRTG